MDELIKQGDVLKCAGGFTMEHMPQYLDKREGEMETIMGMPNLMTKRLLQEVQQ
jgi:septum formation protein